MLFRLRTSVGCAGGFRSLSTACIMGSWDVSVASFHVTLVFASWKFPPGESRYLDIRRLFHGRPLRHWCLGRALPNRSSRNSPQWTCIVQSPTSRIDLDGRIQRHCLFTLLVLKTLSVKHARRNRTNLVIRFCACFLLESSFSAAIACFT